MIIGVLLMIFQLTLLIGVPVLLIAYALPKLGKIVAGRTGMIVGGAGGLLIAAIPLLWIVHGLAKVLIDRGTLMPRYPDEAIGFFILAASIIVLAAVAALYRKAWIEAA